MNNKEPRKIAKNLASLPWSELPLKYSNILGPKHMAIFDNKQSGKMARYHLEQTLCLFRMLRLTLKTAISLKRDTMSSIFDAIVSRIKM